MDAAVILVVEDEPLQRMALCDLVEEAGFAVVEAANADLAVSFLEIRADIRVVMTDIDMPGSMNGLTLAGMIRSRWPAIAIIVVTAGLTPSLEHLPAGSVLLPKPLSPRDVVRTLNGMVGVSDSSAAARGRTSDSGLRSRDDQGRHG